MAVEDLLREGGHVGDGPMVDSCLRDEGESGITDPFPENNIFVADMGLNLLLSLDVENLQCTTG